MQPRSCQEGERSRESACLQYAFTPLAGARRRQRGTRNMVHGKNRIPYRIDRRLTGLAGPDYDATISFGLPLEPEDSQYGKSRLDHHPWMIRRPATPFPLVASGDLRHVQLVHHVGHEVGQMVVSQPLLQRRWQQQLLVGFVGKVGLAHQRLPATGLGPSYPQTLANRVSRTGC